MAKVLPDVIAAADAWVKAAEDIGKLRGPRSVRMATAEAVLDTAELLLCEAVLEWRKTGRSAQSSRAWAARRGGRVRPANLKTGLAARSDTAR